MGGWGQSRDKLTSYQHCIQYFIVCGWPNDIPDEWRYFTVVNTSLNHTLWGTYNLKLSQRKVKIIVFKEKFLIHCKIVVGDEILEQVSHIDFYGCVVNNDFKNKKTK